MLAVVYWIEPASSLPSFIPGHEAGSGHHHIKHGIAAFFVGVALLVYAWFQTGGDKRTDGAVRLVIVAETVITYAQAIILGLLQGVTELFPISSLGHSVILPQLFGWDIHQNDDYFITFLVATHLATAIVLFFFFWQGLDAHLRRDGPQPARPRHRHRTTPTRSSAGCSSPARSPPASSACCSSTRCAASSPRPSRRRSS